MSISVEVMDATTGRPAAGVAVGFGPEADAGWWARKPVRTDEAGRVAAVDEATQRGRYRLVVDLDEYYAGFGMTPFQSRVELVFRVFHSGQPIRILLMITASSCGTHIVLASDDDRDRPIAK